MPQNITLAAFVLGAVLFLLAVSAGGFRIFGAEMSGASGRWSRLVAGFAGVGLIVFAVWPNMTSVGSTPQRVVMGPLETGTNRQGNDFDAFGKHAENAQLCAEMCRVEVDCLAMTYVISLKTCWMKTVVPPATKDSDMISARKVRIPNGS